MNFRVDLCCVGDFDARHGVLHEFAGCVYGPGNDHLEVLGLRPIVARVSEGRKCNGANAQEQGQRQASSERKPDLGIHSSAPWKAEPPKSFRGRRIRRERDYTAWAVVCLTWSKKAEDRCASGERGIVATMKRMQRIDGGCRGGTANAGIIAPAQRTLEFKVLSAGPKPISEALK
jgi:hypothetical protein